jgi:L-aspartate oxidase
VSIPVPSSNSPIQEFDFIVIGSGLAGILFALDAAEKGRVAVITKKEMADASTNFAQGGVAAVCSKEDSFDLHIQDTLRVGDGLCREEAVKIMVENGPSAIRHLMDLGARFTMEEEKPDTPLHLHREGGHSRRRVVHSADLTGREIERCLVDAARKEPNITIFENHVAIDLVLKSRIEGSGGKPEQVAGVFVLGPDEAVKTFLAPATFLAAGGAGKVYLYTSNPDIASGDGLAMAYRAGARIANMEFMQFHPTCLYHPEAKSFLISEAVRGEGGVLRLINGEEFMGKYHEQGSLAPRDVVARAIDTEMKKSGDEYVFLDVTGLDASAVRGKFPNIYRKLLTFGVDITKAPIPVVPAAHYICGGVDVDLWGRTSLKGLYAGGENACTGVHGANRLASNSLLEAVVFSKRAAVKAIEEWRPMEVKIRKPWTSGNAVHSDEQVVITQNWDEIRRVMWSYVGIVRSNRRLERARRRLELLQEEIREYYRDFTVTSDLIELRNIATCAELIIRSAIARRESRGLHFNMDYPQKLPGPPADTFMEK